MQRSRCAVIGIFLCVLTLLALPAPEVAGGGAGSLRVGMPRTFFHDLPPVLVKLATEPFSAVLRDTTGLSGELVIADDAFSAARNLCDNKLQLAVFHSFEFGWVQHKHPELRPLTIAVNSQRSVSAYILVRKDSELASFADLKGRELALPKRTREHCRLYLEHHCQSDGVCDSGSYFHSVVSSANVETALDELCQGKVQSAIVDAIGLEFYKDLKPGCFARLRVLAESGAFPPPVVVYRQGALDTATLDRLRRGLESAHATELGREMMKLWKLTSFDPVPAGYASAVAACVKTYPCPEAK